MQFDYRDRVRFSNDRHTPGTWHVPPTTHSLRQNPPHHLPVNIGQTKLAALETVGQAGVIDAEAVKDGRLEIVDVHG